MLEVDYAPLDHVDVYVFDGPRLAQQAHLGDQVPMGERAMPARSHVLALDLPSGSERVLLLRLQSTGTLIAPLWLRTPAAYLAADAGEQALQGLLAGMGLCLMLYSLVQWFVLRDALFGLYALTLLGTVAFFAALSGVGPQHVWGASDWWTRNAPPFSILVGICGAFLFVVRALEVRIVSPRVAVVSWACAAVAGGTALLFAAGAMGYATAQAIGLGLGPAPLLLVLPVAFKRLRGGDRAAGYVLLGWGAYSIGVLGIVGLLFGWLSVGFWSLHAFQFGSLFEMAMWILVLGLRVQDIRRGAVALRGEHEHMRSLAQTDPLTGLLNRRGLGEWLPALLARAGPSSALAVFALDLDGFKPINDTFGHETGDRLLAAVGHRLQELVRAEDLVCRVGGDEFVLAVGGLAEPADAERIGQKILAAFDAPFNLPGATCRVGLTVGYALAPQDEQAATALLARADAAMYAGKRAGKNCLHRAGRD
jgi:diguanylate cyclase (GGDEF)-like protein